LEVFFDNVDSLLAIVAAFVINTDLSQLALNGLLDELIVLHDQHDLLAFWLVCRRSHR
jgi:hypothetical protein